MKGLDINNPDDKAAIQDILRHGANGDFWKIISQYLQATVDALESQINSDELLNEPANEYKIKDRILKNTKNDRKDLLELPETIVKDLDDPDFFERKRDEEVYAEAEDFEKEE